MVTHTAHRLASNEVVQRTFGMLGIMQPTHQGLKMKSFLLISTLLIVGCEYDAGSSGYTKAFGKEFPQQCILDNLSKLEALSTAEVSDGTYEITREGAISTLKLDMKDGKVTGYTLRTNTVKSQDNHLHKQLADSIANNC